MRRSIIPMSLSFGISIFFLCQCKSSTNNDNSETRIYARDLLGGETAQDYNLKQDVEIVTEDTYYFYKESPIENELTETGKIKQIGIFRRTETNIYDKEGKINMRTISKMDNDNKSLVDYSEEDFYDNKGRRILHEEYNYSVDYETGARNKETFSCRDLYEDEEYKTYHTSIITFSDGNTKKTPRYLFEEYDDNHRLIKKYNDNGEIVAVWSESKNKEELQEYHNGKLTGKSIYDTQGQLIESWSLDKNDILFLTNRIEYDRVERTQTYYYYPEGGTKTVYYYDEDCTESTKIVEKDSNGNVTEEIIHYYDNRDNVVNIVYMFNRKNDHTCSYEYDEKDNWIIKKTTYSGTGTIILNVRHIKYFDGYDSDNRLSDVINDYIMPTPIRKGTNNTIKTNSNSQPSINQFMSNMPLVTSTVIEPSPHELTKFGYVYKDCPLCNHSGKCSTCNGKGWYYGSFGTGELDCPNCSHGECSSCKGTGKIMVFDRLN